MTGLSLFRKRRPSPRPPVVDTSTVPTASLPGWAFLKAQDFTNPATMGAQFLSRYPDWTGYTGHDTSGNGTYDYSKVLSVHDSALDFYVHTEGGVPYTAAPTPPIGPWAQLYGRYAVRFKADAVPGYKIAWLLWPAEPNGWSSGEIDFPEADLSGTIGGFSHQVDGNPAINQWSISTTTSLALWHTAVIEWTPSKLSFILDGVVKSTTDTQAIPHVPMYWALQTETQLSGGAPPASAAGHVYVDWVAAWSYSPGTTPTPTPAGFGRSLFGRSPFGGS
jgi:hypothetical protein